MAARIPPVTVNLEIPVLAELLQSNHDLRREISDLRTELSTRMSAVEARMASQQIDEAPLGNSFQDLVDDGSPVHQDPDIQTNGHTHQDYHARDDGEDNFAQEHGPALEHGLAYDSSPSADEGITVTHQIPLPPAHGRKRKRTMKPASKSPSINHSGFAIQSFDTQLAQRRHEEPGPSRSESPFDPNVDVQESSDRLDMIPPVRPQSRAPVPPQRIRPQRTSATMDDGDETQTSVPGEITMSHDHCLFGYG